MTRDEKLDQEHEVVKGETKGQINLINVEFVPKIIDVKYLNGGVCRGIFKWGKENGSMTRSYSIKN